MPTSTTQTPAPTCSRYPGFPTNSAYQTARAHSLREWLYHYLGEECELCGERCNLEIDHPWGRAWVPSRTSLYKRHLRYRKEALAGLVRLLCSGCNNKHLPKPRGTDPCDPF